MWEFLARQLLKQAGREAAGKFFNDEANGPEAYADRIKRDFRIPDYADAWALYDSNRPYWERYYNPLPNDPDWKADFVRDSAAAAGVPSRNNIFEYGFPSASSAQPSVGGVNVNQPPPVVFDTGAPPVPFVSATSTNASGGLMGLLAEVGAIDPSNPGQPSPGGLPGMILDYLRNNPN
jgi:hypothetical protein